MKPTIKTLLARRLGLLSDTELRETEALLDSDRDFARTDATVKTALNGEEVTIPKRLTEMGDAIWKTARETENEVIPFPVRKRRRLPLAAAAGLLLAVGALFLFTGKEIPRTGISIARGRITINGKNASSRSGIQPGQTLSARKNAVATLNLPAKGVLQFRGPGSLKLVASAVQSGKPKQNWYLKKGTTTISLKPGSYSGFTLSTPHLTLRVTGTRFTVSVDDKGTKVNVSEGRVTVREKNKTEKPLKSGDSLQSGMGNGSTKDPADSGPGISKNRNTSDDNTGKSGHMDNQVSKKTNRLPVKKAAVRKTIREEILLNNGTTLSGRILSQSGGIITFRTGAGTLKIPRSDVKRIRIIKQKGQ